MAIEEIKEIVIECFAEVQSELVEEVDNVIKSTTEFADQGFAGQDIIWSGRMLNSKIVSSTRQSIVIYWDARNPENGFYYPAAVVNGFFAWGGNKYIEGRDFPVRAAQNVDPVQALVDKLNNKGLKARVKSNNINLL